MAHQVESMAYAGQTPWHGLGFPVSNDLTPAEMLVAAQLNWEVEKRQMYMPNSDGTLRAVPGKFALTRKSDESLLSIVGTNWQPNQNSDTVEFFAKWVKAGRMGMETMGSLGGGQFVWALARNYADFSLAGPGRKRKADDEVLGYCLLLQPHVWGYAQTAAMTAVRVVCRNTLNAALGSGLTGKGGAADKVFRMSHSKVFDDTAKAQAEKALGLSVLQMENFQEAATLLAGKKASDEEVKEYFFEVTKFDPEKAKLKKDGEPRQPILLQKIMDALDNAPGQQMGSALGTWWGAFNAVSYVADHELGRERSTALKSAWIGDNATLKRKAFSLALEKAA